MYFFCLIVLLLFALICGFTPVDFGGYYWDECRLWDLNGGIYLFAVGSSDILDLLLHRVSLC